MFKLKVMCNEVLSTDSVGSAISNVFILESNQMPYSPLLQNFLFSGRSYSITTHRMLMSCLESLVQKCQSGVVINFEKIGPDPPVLDGKYVKDDIHTKRSF